MTRAALRIACVLTMALTIASLGAPSLAEARATIGMAPSSAPASAIDLGGLFGNENEPDENEPDEGGGDGKAASGQSSSSGISLPIVLVVGLLALLAGGYAAIRVRRLWLRLRGWGNDLRARL